MVGTRCRICGLARDGPRQRDTMRLAGAMPRAEWITMKRRVVITGMGCVTPLGAQVATVWDRLVAGESGVAEIAAFDAHDFPVRIAAEVRNWSIVDVAGDLCPWEHESRQTQFAVGAAIAAIRSSGLDGSRLGSAPRGRVDGLWRSLSEFSASGPVVERRLARP